MISAERMNFVYVKCFGICKVLYNIFFFHHFPVGLVSLLGFPKNRLQDFCAKDLLETTQVKGKVSEIR